MKPPDILNSKIKKIRIELPHYTFSHSSSGDSPHHFIGRERIREKLKKVIEDSPDEPGVYLIAGNRGVGKTSLVSEVIKGTSLQTKTKFTENIRYVILLFLAVVGTQFLIQFCLQEFPTFADKIQYILSILFGLSFIILCFFNSYRGKIHKQNIGLRILDSITSAFEELSCLINPYNPYGNTQYLLKIILIVCCAQFFSIISCITPTIILFGYLAIVFLYIYIRFIIKNLREDRNKKLSFRNIVFRVIFYDSILNPSKNYIKNHSRLYLRINFGHNLKEKNILRLIARTLSTEYSKYRRSFKRMLPWRAMAFVLLLLFAALFSNNIERQKSYISIKDRERLEVAFSKVNSKVKTTVETNVDSTVETTVETNIDNKKSTNVINPLNILDNFASEISKKAIDIFKYLFGSKVNINIDKNKILGIIFLRDYLFWLLFFLMYLFCKLLFSCTWITHFFVTHRIIIRRLKKLNSDITYSTELENSISVNRGNAGSGIGTKTTKSRNVADAREIEKELQDILGDMQKIPVVMCRPKVVIVFDELDKVEPGETGLEKENLQTKASLFSIGATRERQTEILKILSNMKYFLSSTNAKFIFIAGREMFDIHLADVSERNNYIGSIFNVVILVPSFLTDHHTGEKYIIQESSIASLPEEFVCRRLIPHDYSVDSYNLQNYRIYLEKVIYKSLKDKAQKNEMVQKIIAVLQQFIIYLAHVSKGAPKKMIQLFESFVEIRTERDDKKNTLLVQRYHSSRHFLSFNYYKQYTLGIIAYLITPIFYRLAESNIKEHSDKLLVSSLRFVDFLFKFHKNSFSWKHLDMSPEMLEVNRAPELKSVAVDLLNYLAQVHINKSNFSLSEYKFDGLIANEIFAMAKTDEVFSALFSFSLDEMLPLKKHYQDLLEKEEKEYQKKKKASVYIDAISSLQGVLGDLHYYDDELEEAEAYYKSAVHTLRKLGQKNDEKAEKKDKNKKMTIEQLYVYVRNMLRLGMIYEKRKQYDFAYLTYGELCEQIIHERKIAMSKWQDNSPNQYDMIFEKMTYEGLKILYLPFIAKFQILEKSHVDGINSKHLKLLKDEFEFVTFNIDPEEAKLLEAEYYSRVADILYYKNSDLKGLKCEEYTENSSCTACRYYIEAISTLLNRPDLDKPDKNTVIELLYESVKQIRYNYNIKFCTILARILSDWGNVFFSCDSKKKQSANLEIYINYVNSESKENNRYALLNHFNNITNSNMNFTKMEFAFAMYTISSVAYRKANLYKRSSYQIYKMLCLFKDYKIEYKEPDDYIEQLSEKAIHYLWYANDDLNSLELNKRKKDFGKTTIKDEDKVPLQYLLVDSEITRIRTLVKELELKSDLSSKKLNECYGIHITSPYKINYSIVARIYQLRLKSKVNYETYQQLLKEAKIEEDTRRKEFILKKIYFEKLKTCCNEITKEIFGKYINIEKHENITVKIFENIVAESIYCLIDIAQLSETMEETYLFPHSFLGSVHEHLSFWIRQYEEYETYKEKDSKINKYLEQYLDQEWRDQLSGYRENQRALSHYYKSLEMHNEGRAYHNMIDIMCYVKDDFNDRSDHFNIAEERHLIVNKKIDGKINAIKDIYKGSRLYKVENY